MSKCITALLVLAVAISVQGAGTPLNQEISAAAAAGNWNLFNKLLKSEIGQFNDEIWKEISSANVEDLKPPSGGQVHGESVYTYHTSSNINGQKYEQSGGQKIINDNGKVTKYDFQPKNL